VRVLLGVFPKRGILYALLDNRFPQGGAIRPRAKYMMKKPPRLMKVKLGSPATLSIPIYSKSERILLWCDDGVFEPSVDTEFLLNTTLASPEWKKLRKPRLIDVGCGSGAIGISLCMLKPESRCCFLDVDPRAVGSTRINARIAKLLRRSEFVTSDARIFLGSPGRVYDLALSNPPYVPLPIKGAHSHSQSSAYAGLDLLKGLVKNDWRRYRRLIVVASSCSLGLVERQLQSTRCTIRYLEKNLKVAFSIGGVLDDKNWKRHLLRQGWIEQDSTSLTGYSHLISVLMLSYV